MKPRILLPLAVLATLVTPALGEAQQQGPLNPEVARSFEQLERARTLQPGDTVWILADLAGTGAFEELKGRFVIQEDGTIRVSVDDLPLGIDLEASPTNGGHLIVLPEGRVRQIDHRYADSLGNGVGLGALVGFAALGIPALIASTDCPGTGIVANLCLDLGIALAIGGVGAGIGAGVGAVVDAASKSRRVVYATPGASDTGLIISLSPMISRQRKGLLFTLDW